MKLSDLANKYGDYEISEENFVKYFQKPKSVWDLREGDEYFLISESGDVSFSTIFNQYYYNEKLKIGNTFLTKEEAEKDLLRRKVETALLECGGRRWFDVHNYNYHIGLDDCEEHLKAYILLTPTQGIIYFDSIEQAEKAISIIGEQKIKEILFEVR
jgi:hypothetical protein